MRLRGISARDLDSREHHRNGKSNPPLRTRPSGAPQWGASLQYRAPLDVFPCRCS